VHKLGGRVRWFRLTVWTGIAEIAACRTDVSNVVIACSRSIVVWTGVARKSDQLACLIVQCPWFGGSWVKLNFEHYGVVVGRKCRDSLTLFLTLLAVKPPKY
jgi:hypothetical protein